MTQPRDWMEPGGTGSGDQHADRAVSSETQPAPQTMLPAWTGTPEECWVEDTRCGEQRRDVLSRVKLQALRTHALPVRALV